MDERRGDERVPFHVLVPGDAGSIVSVFEQSAALEETVLVARTGPELITPPWDTRPPPGSVISILLEADDADLYYDELATQKNLTPEGMTVIVEDGDGAGTVQLAARTDLPEPIVAALIDQGTPTVEETLIGNIAIPFPQVRPLVGEFLEDLQTRDSDFLIALAARTDLPGQVREWLTVIGDEEYAGDPPWVL